MIFFNESTQQFEAHSHIATYTNTQDDKVRVKYTSDQGYWQDFVSKWGKDLSFAPLVLTIEQQDRLALLNQQEMCCSQWDAEASLFIEQGIVYTNEVPPYLEGLVDEYGVEPPEDYMNENY